MFPIILKVKKIIMRSQVCIKNITTQTNHYKFVVEMDVSQTIEGRKAKTVSDKIY